MLRSMCPPTLTPRPLLTLLLICRYSPHCLRHMELMLTQMQTGQAVLLAPSGLGTTRESSSKAKMADDERRVLCQFGRKCVLIKTRLRVTKDGGASLLVVPS